MGFEGDHERGSSFGVGAKGTRVDTATSRPSSVPSSSLHTMKCLSRPVVFMPSRRSLP